jgi:lysophospholipase L1-like esterase
MAQKMDYAGNDLIINNIYAGANIPGQGGTLLASGESGEFFNLSPQTLPHWRKAVANVRSGTGRARICVAGASQSNGTGAGTGGSQLSTNAWSKSWPNQYTTMMNSYYVPMSSQSFFGYQNTTASTYPTYDPRVTLGANWGQDVTSFGGFMFKYTTGAANNMTFTPVASFDTIIVYYVIGTGRGTFTWNVDGGSSLGTVNCATGTNGAVATATATVSAGTHTINLIPGNNGNITIAGMITYLSTTPAVDVIQSGIGGATSATYAATTFPYSSASMLNFLAPDLTILFNNVNDYGVPTPISTFMTNTQTLITQAQLTGDIILGTEAPSNTTNSTNGIADNYTTALKQLAITNNCPLLDLRSRWVSYAVTNPIMAYAAGDPAHPTAVGYADWAAMVATATSLYLN